MIAIGATQGQLAVALAILDAGIRATSPDRFEWAARFIQGDREAMIRVLTPSRGRTSEQDGRTIDIVRTAREVRESGHRPTRQRVAERMGRATSGELGGQYKRDVKAAGGWREILRMAG